jgi:hypothetical protein
MNRSRKLKSNYGDIAEINFLFRPSQVTILSLVRDSAARLPGGLGTKQDVVTLFRQSQYPFIRV